MPKKPKRTPEEEQEFLRFVAETKLRNAVQALEGNLYWVEHAVRETRLRLRTGETPSSSLGTAWVGFAQSLAQLDVRVEAAQLVGLNTAKIIKEARRKKTRKRS